MREPQSLILCEGYHDRAFWSGYLQRLALIPIRDRPVFPSRQPFNGEWLFRNESDRLVSLLPCGGKSKLAQQARRLIAGWGTRPFHRLVLSTDSDLDPEDPDAREALKRVTVTDMVRDADPTAIEPGDGDYVLGAGAMTVSLAQWTAPDGPANGLPTQQTLERLVCAAILAAHPEWADPVHRWLESRPGEPRTGPKSYSWSYLAGWFGKFDGYEAFLCKLWIDEAIAVALEERLAAAGVHRIGLALKS